MNRRQFIRHSFLIGAGFSFLSSAGNLVPALNAFPTKSRVVQITNSLVRYRHGFHRAQIEKMLDDGIAALYDTEEPGKIWRQLFSKKDTVGIKVNCLSGERGSSHKILVEAIAENLQQAGVKPKNIIIWDRLNEDLENAGFRINIENKNKIRCFGNDAVAYDNRLYLNGSVGSLITRTVTRLCTALINVPVLKDHGIVGVTLSMKNFFGAIHNPNKYHLNNGNPYVADLYEMDIIRRKVRLTICDALDAQYEGGPPFKPQWSWQMNGMLMALDAVALDRVGWQIIEERRAKEGFPSLKKAGREPAYILTAGRKGIGQADLSRIDWLKREFG